MEKQGQKLAKIKKVIGQEYVGKEDIIEAMLVALLSGGHILLEDVPGIGKTTLAKVFAKATGLSMGRIQFTPDTMPGDVTGFTVYQMHTGEFVLKQGAVMHQLLLADEINRTPPKTQSSLLEAMAENQVTIEEKTISLPSPFMVIATQNPVEYAGTYPLPEAQLDRFMMKLSIGYPSKEEELKIAAKKLGLQISAEETAQKQVKMQVAEMSGERVEAQSDKTADEMDGESVTAEDILSMKKQVSQVLLSEAVCGYTQELIALTRADDRITLGASTRAYLALLMAGQACAYLAGRDYVKPDDIKKYANPVLAHRLVLSSKAKRENVSTEKLIREFLTKVRVPV